jgi:hypothetical protein
LKIKVIFAKFKPVVKKVKKEILIILLISLFTGGEVLGSNSDNISGWAWSDNIGWISFNNITDGSAINYGVRISTSTGKFSGYAWSDNIGWISFNRSDTGPPPEEDPCPDGSCIAKLEHVNQLGFSNVNVIGWARALSACPSDTDGDGDLFNDPCQSTDENVGGWSGWIKFNHGSSNEVYVDADPDGDNLAEFHGFAWSDQVVGWISFNCEEGGSGGGNICSTSDYKVFLDLLSFNQNPTASTTGVTWDDCSFKGISIPTFHWTYSDPDGDSMGGYEIEIQGESTFFASSSETSTAYTLQNTAWIENNLLFGKTYSWRIRVKDDKGAWSDWDQENFSTRPHAYPWVNFKWNPQRPPIGEAIQFCSLSTGTCSTIIDSSEDSECFAPPCNFLWTFENATPSFSTLANPTTTFFSPAQSTITLTITDSDGLSCTKEETIKVTYPLPKWREIPPFSFLQKQILSRNVLTPISNFVKMHLTNFFGKLKLKL